jgi:hypothetical protein
MSGRWQGRKLCCQAGFEFFDHTGRGLIDAAAIARHHRHVGDIGEALSTYMGLETIRALLHAHKALHEELKAAVIKAAPEEASPPLPQKRSPQDEQMFASIESSNQQPSNEFDTCNPRSNVGFQVSVAACIPNRRGLHSRALADPHSLPRSPPVGPHSSPLRRHSRMPACTPSRRAHRPCHSPPAYR